MIVYPIPIEVTQARIQLLVDQTAKAPPDTINADLNAVYDAKSQATQVQIRQHAEQHAQRHAEQHVQPVEQPAPTPAPAEPHPLVDVKV